MKDTEKDLSKIASDILSGKDCSCRVRDLKISEVCKLAELIKPEIARRGKLRQKEGWKNIGKIVKESKNDIILRRIKSNQIKESDLEYLIIRNFNNLFGESIIYRGHQVKVKDGSIDILAIDTYNDDRYIVIELKLESISCCAISQILRYMETFGIENKLDKSNISGIIIGKYVDDSAKRIYEFLPDGLIQLMTYSFDGLKSYLNEVKHENKNR